MHLKLRLGNKLKMQKIDIGFIIAHIWWRIHYNVVSKFLQHLNQSGKFSILEWTNVLKLQTTIQLLQNKNK
jgi:hypothetical protein